MLHYDGIEGMTQDEVRAACEERGMLSVGLTDVRLPLSACYSLYHYSLEPMRVGVFGIHPH